MGHSCDISNPAKPTKMATQWAHVICDEFWNQGDLEKSMNMIPDQLLRREDRTTAKGRRAVAKGQIGFLKFIVKPLFEVGASQLPFFKEVACPHLEENLKFWQEQ